MVSRVICSQVQCEHKIMNLGRFARQIFFHEFPAETRESKRVKTHLYTSIFPLQFALGALRGSASGSGMEFDPKLDLYAYSEHGAIKVKGVLRLNPVEESSSKNPEGTAIESAIDIDISIIAPDEANCLNLAWVENTRYASFWCLMTEKDLLERPPKPKVSYHFEVPDEVVNNPHLYLVDDVLRLRVTATLKSKQGSPLLKEPGQIHLPSRFTVRRLTGRKIFVIFLLLGMGTLFLTLSHLLIPGHQLTPAGNMYIPQTQRPDGTWRKPIPVKAGYVPPEEQPLYVSKGRPTSERSKYPVGPSDADFAPSSRASGVASGSNIRSAGHFEVGEYEQARVIPGLNFVESSEDEAKKKKKPNGKPAEVVENGKQAPASIGTKSQPAVKASSKGQETDPNKRLRNLRKKLKDIEIIETLKVKLKTGELQNPDPDELEKVKRKKAVIDEIEELVDFLSSMNL